MRVLIVSETLHTGGAEVFILRLSRYLLKAGVDVTVLNMNRGYEDQALTERYPELKIERIHIPFFRLLDKMDEYLNRAGIDFSIKYFLQSGILKRKYAGQYDIVHSNYSRIDYIFATINQRKKLFHHLVGVHGDYSDQFYREQKKERTGWLNSGKKIKKIAEEASALAIVSEEQRRFFISQFNIAETKLHKIYYGFEEAEIKKPSYESNKIFTIGMVARGTAQKGWQLLIDAFLQLPKGARLVLVGGSDYMDQLKDKYAGHQDIFFRGFLSDPLTETASFDVAVLPTLYPFESLPNSIIEALFCGKPVIASDVGEIRSMITDQASGEMAGYLIDVDDKEEAVNQITSFLQLLWKDENQRKRLSEVANKCFSRFKMETCVNKYIDLYKNILGQKS